jgi:hypothetical protein
MKRTAMLATLTAVIMTIAAPAAATEFWETYATRLVYNYSIKAGAVPEEGMNQRLTSHEVLGVASKSFSQSFGDRFTEVAHANRFTVIVCIFSPAPESCYFNNVSDKVFGEIKLVKAPKIPQKILKRLNRFYAVSLAEPKSPSGIRARAMGVPARNRLNPRFGFSMTEPEIIAAAPFYTFFGIYAEPKYGSRNGASLSLMKGDAILRIENGGFAIQYRIPSELNKFDLGNLVLTYRSNGNIRLDNMFLVW